VSVPHQLLPSKRINYHRDIVIITSVSDRLAKMHFSISSLGVLLGLTLPSVLGSEWSGWGGNIFNNRWASKDVHLSSHAVQKLSTKCRVDYHIGVSATPVVLDNIVYYPTWSGAFVALNYEDCKVQWEVNVTKIVLDFGPIIGDTNVTTPVSRTSPAIDGDILYFGTLTHALVVAVDRGNGRLLGVQQLNPHPVAIITQSPTFYDGKLFVGSSSEEETAAAVIPNYPCCSFIGSMAALTFDRDAGEFHVAWNRSMLPFNTQWSGVGVWGSQPAIDPGRRQVFIGTGNVYTNPPEFNKCANESATCLPADILQEAIIAYDIDSGEANWVERISPLDAWTVACIKAGNPQNCPPFPGVDADFGMAPAFVPSTNRANPHGDVVVLGQKNGILYSLSAQTGQLIWSTQATPDGTAGGLSWGVAADNSRVYFTGINSLNVTWQLLPSNQTIQNSAFGAASLATGELLWETQTPDNNVAFGPPSVIGEVIAVTRTGQNTANSANTKGGLVFLSPATGEILADIELDANSHSGVAAYGKNLFFGTGYSGFEGTGSLYVMG
jgi:outer membrane protein assembly factor BamB